MKRHTLFALLCGLVLGALVCAALGPLAVRAARGDVRPAGYVATVDIPNAVAFEDLGLKIQRFRARGLPDHRIVIWMEVYVDGKLREDLSRGSWRTPAKGEAIDETFRFSRRHRGATKEDGLNEVIWQFAFDGTRGLHDWMADPLEGISSSCGPVAERLPLAVGETQTVLRLVASDGPSMFTGSDESALKNPYAVLFKCRMLGPDPKGRTSVTGSFSGLPKLPE